MENQGPNSTQSSSMSPKTLSVIAYITIIGWIIAFVLNNNNRSEIASFHIRQFLGIFLTGIALSLVNIIPILGQIVFIVGWIFLIILWIMGLISAVNGEMKEVPVVGKYYQEWFRGV